MKHIIRRLAFTLLVALAAILALVFPNHILKIGVFSTQTLIIPLLMLIMFGMGTTMSVADFKGVVKMPRGVLIGVICQFSIMPVIGFSLAKLSGFPPEIAAGIILVGCSPSGLASNVMAYIAGANVALSVTLTAVATLLAPILTPFLMQLLADAYVPIDFLSMMWSIAKIVIIPIVVGLLLNHFFEKHIKQIKGIFPLISMTGIVVIIAIITAAGRDALLDIGFLLILAVITHNIL
ncbi:MAG: bile acid:sodium symporter family protein, partial [Bacteroidota bacterium]